MLIKRENYLKKIRPFYDLDIIKVIVGPRRAGKSKILEQIMIELREKGIDGNDIIYINFEKLEYDAIDNYLILNQYIADLINDTNKKYLFFDEIQHVAQFEKAINSFRVSFNCSIFITGSNSKILSSEISTLLTGRIIEFTIYPFSYTEANEYCIQNKIANELSINNYMELGGFPLRFDLADSVSSKKYLRELLNNICEKDIYYRDRDIEKEKFTKVCKYILANSGREINSKKVFDYLSSNNNKCALSSIYKYFEKMEKAFIVVPIYRYNIPGKEVLKSNPKYYAIDTGFKSISLSNSAMDVGFYLENIVCLELLNRGFDVYIGKTYKGEVDFIAVNNNKKCYIQVAYIMENENTIKREFGAFAPIKDSSPKYVLSLDNVDMSRDGIIHMNIVDFLLNKEELHMS